jgi:hypothetical protein
VRYPSFTKRCCNETCLPCSACEYVIYPVLESAVKMSLGPQADGKCVQLLLDKSCQSACSTFRHLTGSSRAVRIGYHFISMLLYLNAYSPYPCRFRCRISWYLLSTSAPQHPRRPPPPYPRPLRRRPCLPRHPRIPSPYSPPSVDPSSPLSARSATSTARLPSAP